MGMSRRQFGLSAAAAATAPLALGAPTAKASTTRGAATAAAPLEPPQASAQAVAAYDAMQKQYYLPATHLYHEFAPFEGGDPYSTVYAFSQVQRATLDMLGLPGVGGNYAGDVADRVKGLAAYYNPSPQSYNPPSPPAPPSPPLWWGRVMPPLDTGGNGYYDDNEWIGLNGLQEHLMTGDAAALDRAKAVSTLIDYGWDTNAGDPDPGGTFWTQGSFNHDRNTISNGPGAEVQTRLYLLTKDPSYLSSAKRQFAWVVQYMQAPNELFWDHVSIDGSVDHTQWSYNQGVMLGAAALLYQATGVASYLTQARAIATDALQFYSGAGRIFTSGIPFDAIFFRNLLLLDSIDRDDARYQNVLQAMRSYTGALAEAVDPTTGLVGIQPYNPIDILDQAAYTQLNALLAWDRADYHLLA